MSYNYSHIGHAGFGKATQISERKSPLQTLPGWSGPGSSVGTEPVGRRAKAALGQGASPHPQPARRGQFHTVQHMQTTRTVSLHTKHQQSDPATMCICSAENQNTPSEGTEEFDSYSAERTRKSGWVKVCPFWQYPLPEALVPLGESPVWHRPLGRRWVGARETLKLGQVLGQWHNWPHGSCPCSPHECLCLILIVKLGQTLWVSRHCLPESKHCTRAPWCVPSSPSHALEPGLGP